MRRGGSSPTPTPSPVNRAPSLTASSTSVSVVENTTGTLATFQASDPDRDTVTLSLSGEDASFFSLSSGGALTFAGPPNFDAFADANADNDYVVAVQASDGRGGTASRTITVRVTNDREGVAVTRIATGLGPDPVVSARPNSDALLVVRQDGRVIVIDSATGAQTAYGNFFTNGESGRVLAVHDHVLISLVVLDIEGVGIVLHGLDLTGYREAGPETLATSSTLHPHATFVSGPGEKTFVALGDPDGANAQVGSSGYGKLVDVLQDPYCGASTRTVCLSQTIVGDGIHAPGGATAYLNKSILFDRGQDQHEEITYFDPSARPLDFGWPYYEGAMSRVTNPPAQINGPNVTYQRGDGPLKGTGVVGGAAYTGPIASLTGHLLFGDVSGKIFTVPLSYLTDGVLHQTKGMQNRSLDFAPDSGRIDAPRNILRDRTGTIFVLDSDGELFRVSAS